MKILCFDAEFANEAGMPEEILELSVWETDGIGKGATRRQAFHQYFRPVAHRTWPHSQRVHHITPAMVSRKPPFSAWRGRIQEMIDNCDFIVGFAIDNDIQALSNEGIRGLENKRVIDVKDMHWLINTKHQGVDLNSRKGLGTTAIDIGVPFSENLAHGADYDTRITLDCFHSLIEAFCASEKESLASSYDKAGYKIDDKTGLDSSGDTEKILAHYLQRWEEEHENALREYARGWIALISKPNGYRLKATRNKPDGGDIIAKVEVMARQRALDEMDAHFDRKRDTRDCHVYRLTSGDIEWFRKYVNEYDGNEPFHKKMAELRQLSVRH